MSLASPESVAPSTRAAHLAPTLPPPAPADCADPTAAVRECVLRSGTSFYWGMRLLPEERRNAMFAIYAFCREVDDIADEEGSLDDKLIGLQAWREEVDRVLEGTPRTAIGVELAKAARAFGLQRADFIAIIDGMEMDAREDIRAPSMEVLDLYCARVASAVGLLSVRAFGASAAEGEKVAYHLGRALQLTNILRDIDEDAERGRLYLPRELLEQAGITEAMWQQPDLSQVLAHPGLEQVGRTLAKQARAHFDQAEAAMALCSKASMRPARIMKAVYGRILTKLEARGWQAPRQPVSIPKWLKMGLAFRHGVM